MLVLSRKNGQCINIGGNIIVKVLDVRGDRVRLGLSAPEDMNIQRQELRHPPAREACPWAVCGMAEAAT